MNAATVLLLASGTLAMLVSYITRVEARGPYSTLGQGPMWRVALAGLTTPCMIALIAWAAFVYPWQWLVGGVLFFMIVIGLLQGFVLAALGGLSLMQRLIIWRSLLDATLVTATITLWWKYYPIK